MQMRELTEEEFKNFEKTHPQQSIYQTVEYAHIMEKQGFIPLFVGLKRDVIIAGVMLLIDTSKTFKYAYAPRGFLLDYNDLSLLETFTKELKKFLGKRDIAAVKLNPLLLKRIYNPKNNTIENNKNYEEIFRCLQKLDYYHYGYNNEFEALKPRFEAILNLDVPYYTIYQNLRKEFRTKIRGAIKSGIKVYKGNKQDLSLLYLHTEKKYPRNLRYFEDTYDFFTKEDNIEFYYTKLDTQIYLKNAQDMYTYYENESFKQNDLLIHAKGINKNKILTKKMNMDMFYNKYKKELVDATELLKNYPDGIVTSSILIIKKEDTITLFMDGYDPKFKRFNAKHLLIWKIIEKYAKYGYKKFNLGGVSNFMIQSKKYHGLNEFKKSFGANIYEYAGDFELICNRTTYFMYRNSNSFLKKLKKFRIL